MFQKSLSKLVIAKSAVLLSLQLTSFGQSPGGLDPKFSLDIQRDVGAFVQGTAGQNEQAALQQNLVNLILRTGTNARTLKQIVSESVSAASTTPGHNVEKIARVVQIATLSAVSGALSAETSNAAEVIEGIADTVTFQFVSLSAKGDSDPSQQLAMVTQAIAFGVGVALFDEGQTNAYDLTSKIAKGALSGTYKAARIHNMDSMTNTYAAQGLASGIIQLSVVHKADVVSQCKAISRGAFEGILAQPSIRLDQASQAGASTVQGLLEGAANAKGIYANAQQQLDGKTLASITISTFDGVKESLAGDLPAALAGPALRNAAFTAWASSMYKFLPGTDPVAQERIVVSLYENSLGVPSLQQSITSGIVKELVARDATDRARELYPIITEGATSSIYKSKGEITHDDYQPFVQTAVELYLKELGAEGEDDATTTFNVYRRLLEGAIRSILHEQKLLLRNTARISEILAGSAVHASSIMTIPANDFLKGAAGGIASAAMTSAVSKDVNIQAPETLVEGSVEGMQVGFIIGLMSQKRGIDEIGHVLKSSALAAGSSTIEIGRRIEISAVQLSHFAEGVAQGSTSGIAKLLTNQQVSKALGSGAGKLIEQAAHGVALGSIASLTGDITHVNLKHEELIGLAEAISYGAAYGAVVNGPLEKAPEFAQSSASGTVLGTVSFAAPMFEKADSLTEIKSITLSTCKGAAEGAITAGAQKNLDLKAIARSAAYGGTSAATLAVIAASQPPATISEVAKQAARGMVQGTMEASYAKMTGAAN